MTLHFDRHEGRQPQGTRALYAFPAKLLGLSLTLTLMVVIWMGSNSLYIHHFLSHDVADTLRVTDQAAEILYMDTVQTQTARTGAGTGDPEFDRRYMEVLKQDIAKQIDVLSDRTLLDMLHALSQSNNHLVDLEMDYQNLLAEGKFKEADQLIHGEEFKKYSTLHMDSRRNISKKVREASHQNLLKLENNIYVALLLVSMVILILFVAWFFAFRSVRRWREELEASRSRELRAKESAESANAALTISERVAKQSASDAEKANQAKSEFLSNMSHELRTPMHAILGFARLVHKRIGATQDGKVIEMISNIQISGNRLLNLLNALLDLSKLEADKMEFDFRKGNIRKAIDQTLLELTPLVQEKQMHVSLHDEGDPKVLVYDYKSMVQVFMNLLSNAVKFSPAGSEITITLTETSTPALQSAVLCRIRDYGTGIPDKELALVFDKFVQSSKTRTGAGGTGLGLAIVKQIVEAHHGRIWAENVVPNGACFNLLLPHESVNPAL